MSDFKDHTPRKEDILKLRSQGLCYREIAKKLGCAKSTISYHCGKNQSEKKRVTNQSVNVLCKKVSSFRSRCTADSYRAFRTKIKGFRSKTKGLRCTSGRVNNISKPYNCKDVLYKIGENPICYLTGKKIDINASATYHLDHITPNANGGTNDLSNMGICCAEANQAKGALSVDEFYSLCEEVLAWRDKSK